LFALGFFSGTLCSMAIAAIITGGQAPEPRRIRSVLKHCDIIIAADSGFVTASEWSIEVTEVVGDFDSFPGGAAAAGLAGVPIRRFSADKDYSDTELALRRAVELGAERRILIGGGEGRIDHLLANLSLFSKADVAPDLWLSGDSEMLRIGLGSHRLTGSSGRTLSILPLGPGSGSVRSKGLRWNLDHLDWSETPISLSNRGVSSTIELTVERGSFLVIAPYLDDQLYLSPTFIENWR
jgi:thiamine pyrophosphokinase